MQLVELRADNFRRFAKLRIRIDSRISLFVGENAAGKTTLLEAVYLLSRGRSFRGQSPQELQGPAGDSWTVFGRTQHGAQPPHAIGLQWRDRQLAARIDGKAGVAAELLQLTPVQILEPSQHRLIAEGPTYRRSFVDWGVFHVEHSFMPNWRRYRRALRQRNQALRSRASDAELAVWEPELAAAGDELQLLRQAHLDALKLRVAQRLERLLGPQAWAFDLQPGWTAGLSLAEALKQGRDRDRRMGTTVSGPHRAELRIRLDAHSARSRISRGQQKLLLAALLLSQCEEIESRSGVAPVLLVDDFSAELAAEFQERLLRELKQYQGQVLITSFEGGGTLAGLEMFHVEHSGVRAA